VLAPGGAVVARSFGYDQDNRRLIGITTARSSDGQAVQALSHVYDPVGNITHVEDSAAPGANVVAAGQVVTPTRDFTYDALYRLTGATGRAHTALTRDNEAHGGYQPFFAENGALSDPNALYRYRTGYDYDDSGNLTTVRFFAPPDQPGARWTRSISVDTASNRAVDSDTLGSQPISAFFDAAGNQTRTGGLPALIWDYRNRLRRTVLVDRGAGAQPDAQYQAHDGSGLRVRKTTQRLIASGGLRIEDTFYFGGLEITRVRQGATVVEERQRLRLMDEDACVAERLSWTIGDPPASVSGPQLRFQIEDRQGSSALELDAEGKLVSYEEYAPYGVTVYATGPSLAEVSLKRYRFSGQERDQDTGLYDYGARHYAPWLGRWLSPDPAGPVDGLNLYAFVGGNPVTWEDGGGLAKKTKKASSKTASTKSTGKSPSKKQKKQVSKNAKQKAKAVAQGGGVLSKAAQKRLAKKSVTPKKQSPRQKEKREKLAAQFAAPASAVGHYYKGTEIGMQSLFGSTSTLTDDIKFRLETDIAAFKVTNKARTGVPKQIADYAAKNWARGDFLESIIETVDHPGKSQLKRPKYSAGTISPRVGAGKIGAAAPHGGYDTSIDDAGHLVPEAGVSDTNATKVNSPDNVIPENWVVNQKYKKAFEDGVKGFAMANPTLHVMTIHQPNYVSSKGALESFRARPKEVIHFMAINGTIVSAFTFKNSKHVIMPRTLGR
jgi:RHS repeat-associated protein